MLGTGLTLKNATAFLRWVNRILKDYLLKGYAVNRDIQLQLNTFVRSTIYNELKSELTDRQ